MDDARGLWLTLVEVLKPWVSGVNGGMDDGWRCLEKY